MTKYQPTPERFVFGLATVVLLLLVVSGCGDQPTVTPTRPTSVLPPTTGPAVTVTTTGPVVPTTASASLTVGPVTATPVTTNVTPEGAIPTEVKPAYQAALTDLTKRNQVTANGVKLAGYQFTQFSDSSLGCPQPNTMYSQVITPGYILNLEANGQTFEYHTNLAGTRAVLCGGLRLPPPVNP